MDESNRTGSQYSATWSSLSAAAYLGPSPSCVESPGFLSTGLFNGPLASKELILIDELYELKSVVLGEEQLFRDKDDSG